MRHSRRDGPNLISAVIIVFAMITVVYVLFHSYIEQREACERRGGVYFCPYESICLCLAKGKLLQ